MKQHRMAALAAAAALAITSTVISVPVQAAPEELMNSTFEDGYGAWKGVGSTISITSDYAHNGDSSLYVFDRTASWGAPRCSLSGVAVPGQTYTFSAYAMFADGNDYQNMALKLIYTDSSGKDQYKDIKNVNAKKGEWTQLTGSYSIPENVTNIILYVEMPGANTDQCYYIDDITVNGEKVDVSYATEYNNDFDDGTAQGWTGRGSATASVVNTASHSGDYSLFISGRTQLWNGATINKSDMLQSGKYYSLGCYVMYNEDKWSDQQKFSINLQYDLNGKENYYTIATATANKGEWTYVGSELTIPEGAVNCAVYIQTGYVSTPAEQDLMDFYVDDCTGKQLPDPAIQDDLPALKDAYAEDFKLGCAATDSELTQKASQDLILKHYNSLTLGNELKPDSVLNQAESIAYLKQTGDDTNPQISLKSADKLLKFAAKNHIPVRGHVLVWHSQTPDWFFKENYEADGAWVDKDTMNKRLENYIKNVMTTLAEEYPDVEFYAWDVVNEAASDAGTMREAGSNNVKSGQSAWVQVYGDQSYILKAFEYARKYAPTGCKLFYNDYNEYNTAKMNYIVSDILKPLIAAGTIDGMGMQSHISMSTPTIAQYKKAMQTYSDLGLEIQVTELDVSQKSNAVADQLELAQRYQDCFKMYKEMKASGVNLSAVVIWGITDSTSWIGGYPLLFDKDYQAKPSYYAVVDTDSEVEKLQTMTAYHYDGTDADLERALEIGTIQYLNDTTTYFKAAWSEKGMVIRVYNPRHINGWEKQDGCVITTVDYPDILVYGSQEKQQGAFLDSVKVNSDTKFADITIPLTGKIGSNVYLDVQNCNIAWNDTDTSEKLFGEFIQQSTLTYKSATPTCGIVTLKAQPKSATATYGTPTIDGTIDSVWEDAPTIDVNTFSVGNGATGTAKMLWDENNLYILTEVTDPVLSKSSANAYEQDTVEVFFDENNHKTDYYETDDLQARVNYDNEKTITDGLSTDRFVSATAKTDKGYLVEMAIPFGIAPFQNGQVLGFDVQVNDDGTGDGKRTAISNWNDLTGMGYTSTAGYGVLTLTGGSSETTTSATTTTGTSTTTTTTATTVTTTGTLENINYGDVNLDGVVDLTDSITLNKYLGQVLTLSDVALKNADVNMDQNLTERDTTILMRFILQDQEYLELPHVDAE